MIYTCKLCDIEFSAFPSDKRTYCSWECRNKSKNRVVICRMCNREFSRPKSRGAVYCSRDCSTKRMGQLHPQWKTGIRNDGHGYKNVWSPYHPYTSNQGYVQEHRLIVEQKLKRFLKPKEIIHHINHDKSDNRLENLFLFSNQSDHIKIGHSKNSKLTSNLL